MDEPRRVQRRSRRQGWSLPDARRDAGRSRGRRIARHASRHPGRDPSRAGDSAQLHGRAAVQSGPGLRECGRERRGGIAQHVRHRAGLSAGAGCRPGARRAHPGGLRPHRQRVGDAGGAGALAAPAVSPGPAGGRRGVSRAGRLRGPSLGGEPPERDRAQSTARPRVARDRPRGPRDHPPRPSRRVGAGGAAGRAG